MFNLFKKDAPQKNVPQEGIQTVGQEFKPQKGTFFQTLEYGEYNDQDELTGKIWLEAGYNPEHKSWVLWHKSVRQIIDPFTNEETSVLTTKALFEKTSFVEAYDQMTTFEKAQQSVNKAPLTLKTPQKLAGDYFKQFAWREGLMMDRAGRLYPVTNMDLTQVAGQYAFFNESDITDARAYLNRLKDQQFIPVPIVLPSIDFEKTYKKDQVRIDTRLNKLKYDYGDNKDELTLQIIAHEAPEILYAYLKSGFNPRELEKEPSLHFKALKAAIERENVNVLSLLLSEAGLSFYVRHNDETPVEIAIQKRAYSHLHLMLSREGAKLANYRDESDNAPISMIIEQKDAQAFRMFYLEGLDYQHADQKGWKLIHHGAHHHFMPAIYAWMDEGLPLDEPTLGENPENILSIAKQHNYNELIEFAKQHGVQDIVPATLPSAVTSYSIDELFSRLRDYTISNADIQVYAQNLDLSKEATTLYTQCYDDPKRSALIQTWVDMNLEASAFFLSLAGGKTLPLDLIKALVPAIHNPHIPDKDGNHFLHLIQMSAYPEMSHSMNVARVLTLLPEFQINAQNHAGLSLVDLALSLDRGQTLKNLPNDSVLKIDWMQTDKKDWTPLDRAFTKQPSRIKETSQSTQEIMVKTLDKVANSDDPQAKSSLTQAFNRPRPDQRTILTALEADQSPHLTALKTISQKL